MCVKIIKHYISVQPSHYYISPQALVHLPTFEVVAGYSGEFLTLWPCPWVYTIGACSIYGKEVSTAHKIWRTKSTNRSISSSKYSPPCNTYYATLYCPQDNVCVCFFAGTFELNIDITEPDTCIPGWYTSYSWVVDILCMFVAACSEILPTAKTKTFRPKKGCRSKNR